jgi:hypothetical protein
MPDVGGIGNRVPSQLPDESRAAQKPGLPGGQGHSLEKGPVASQVSPASLPSAPDSPVGPLGPLGQPTGMPIPGGPGPGMPDVLAGRDPSQLIAAEQIRVAGGGTVTDELLGLNLQPTMAGALLAPPGNTDFLRHMTPLMRRNAVRELLSKQREQMRRLATRFQIGSDDQKRRDNRDGEYYSQDEQETGDELPNGREYLQLATAARMLYLVEELLAMQDYTFSRMGTFSKG